MKQALHIFLKDVRRLWPMIAFIMLAIAYFAELDIRLPRLGREGMMVEFVVGTGLTTIIEFIVGAAVWFLIARTVHEESLPGENQFWLTRPYERGSLLASKIMTAVFVVSVPLFVADCVILSTQALNVTGNMGGLILRQVLIAAWLILPPFAIASITRAITEDILVWLGGLAIAGLTYFTGDNTLTLAKEWALAGAILLIAAAIWRQYLRRGTVVSRVLVAAAVFLPALPFPYSAALAIERLQNDPATEGVSLTPKVESIAGSFQTIEGAEDWTCAPIPIAIYGVQKGWRLAILSQKDTFELDGGVSAGGKTWSTGWRRDGAAWDINESATAGNLRACVYADVLRALSGGKTLSAHVRIAIAMAVIAKEAPIDVKAQLTPFVVPGVGTCEFQNLRFRLSVDNYFLSCKAPIRFPLQGNVGMMTEDSWSSDISYPIYPVTPLNLLPGLSPVFKWVIAPTSTRTDLSISTMSTQIQRAIAEGGQVEFRPERRIAVLEREITIPDVRFSGMR